MEGSLFTYNTERRLVAFRFGKDAPTGDGVVVVFIGGLTDGLLCVPYLGRLSESLSAIGATLIQPLLTSSYGGFGTCSLATDARDIASLLRFLLSGRNAPCSVVLVGHSTGCQDAVAFLGAFAGTPEAECVKAIVLQGPVSDRDWMVSNEEGIDDAISATKALRDAGLGHEIVPHWRYDGGAPVSADRLWSLCGGRLTDDDMFSNDLTHEEMTGRFACVGTRRVVVLASERDEYVPDGVDREAIARRIAAAMPSMGSNATVTMVPDCHSVTSEVGISVVCHAISSLALELKR